MGLNVSLFVVFDFVSVIFTWCIVPLELVLSEQELLAVLVKDIFCDWLVEIISFRLVAVHTLTIFASSDELR